MTDDDDRCAWPSTVRPGLTCTWPHSTVGNHHHHGPARATTGQLCPGHYAKLERTIRELPLARQLMLANLSPTATASDGEPVSGSGDRQDAIRINVLDIADRLSDNLYWTPATVAYADRCYELCELLQRLVDEAHRVVPWRLGRHRVAIRCPACGLSLYAKDGRDDALCAGCGLHVSRQDIDRVVALEAARELAAQEAAMVERESRARRKRAS